MYLIDTHAHLDMIRNMTPAETVEKSKKEGVKYIINIGSSIEGSIKSLEYSQEFPEVFASIGLHPHHAEGFGDKEIHMIESLIMGGKESIGKEGTGSKYKKVVAVGETGFDLYRELSPVTDQERAFRAQIELAIKYDIPLVVHDRDAHKHTIDVLREYAGHKGFRGVVHCFSGDTAFAFQCLELGFYISFTGVITFPNAKESLEAVKEVPIERMFVETDAPFLAPQAKRGKENYSGYVKYVAEKIAETKGMSFEEVSLITSKNAVEFFGLRIKGPEQ